MTRGTFYYFSSDGKVYASNEFNGDMYFEGHGEDAAKGLSMVNSLDDFKKFVRVFNRKHFRYPDDEVRTYCIGDAVLGGFLNMDNYFQKYGSDYIYLMNATDNPMEFILRDGDKEVLPAHSSGVLHFGRQTESFPSSLNAFGRSVKCVPEKEKLLTDVQKACALNGVTITKEEENEVSMYMAKMEEPVISNVYKTLYDYAHDDAVRRICIAKWIIPYFDFKAYAEDIKDRKECYVTQKGTVFIIHDFESSNVDYFDEIL